MKACRVCGEEKNDIEFRGSSDLCKKCSMKPAIATNLKNRDDRPHGQNKGDIVVCETCGNSFVIKKTVKKTRKVCSLKCNRAGKEITEKGLSAMRDLTEEQKEARAKKAAGTMTGRAGRGRAAKGTRHHAAKFYELKGPDRTLYEFKNLRHFIRTNKHLFSEDELKTYSTSRPGTTYAEVALRNLFALRKDGERRTTHWHGWTIGDKSEESLKMKKRARDDTGRYK